MGIQAHGVRVVFIAFLGGKGLVLGILEGLEKLEFLEILEILENLEILEVLEGLKPWDNSVGEAGVNTWSSPLHLCSSGAGFRRSGIRVRP